MFVFNHNYDDKEQVREWLSVFSELREEMEANGRYPYNDSFKGQIPGIVGDDEDTAIYLLQCLYKIEREHERVAAYQANGYSTPLRLDQTTRYEHVVIWRKGKYVGGTGDIVELDGARVVVDTLGHPTAVLPKGKRTHGYPLVNDYVLLVK